MGTGETLLKRSRRLELAAFVPLLAAAAACVSPSSQARDAAAPVVATLPEADTGISATLDASTAIEGSPLVDAGSAAALDGGAGDAAADAYACGDLSVYNPKIVCFGDDASAYTKYLFADSGAGPTRCPAGSDFVPSGGEGSCGYSACGPLPPSVVPADAAADGAASCCFLVVSVCGL